MKPDPPPSGGPRWPLLLFGVFVALCLSASLYRPDRPASTIVPGSSAGPEFVVQLIRPRSGLPLGGLLPPQLFGLDAELGFDSASAGATVGSVGPERLELAATGWELSLVLDSDGHVDEGSAVVFELVFEDKLRKVRCQPGIPAVGTYTTEALSDSGELSGHFDIELARCEDVSTGAPIAWPPQPLVLHGSFDRLALDGGGP